ncbi:YhcN/YlaJ family sporulation lipoprotein [Virgibacillus flavescens]|uniref:YhcN/YlaJ family sporulation lipoprotein n=1 Tax=Virgibacillus flavescens TaxID=1611422 RepID=UPI003D343925
MKIKFLGITLITALALVGCQNDNGTKEADPNNNDDTNVEQTRFNAGDQNSQDFDMNNNGKEYDLSEEAAEKITQQVKGVESANVVTTENNAYVAAEINATADTGNGNGLSEEVKKQISKIVKSTDSDIDNVYVSTNPDFADLATRYADQAENGEPIEGIFDQMGNMIERVFPQKNE